MLVPMCHFPVPGTLHGSTQLAVGKWSLLILDVLPQLAPSLRPRTGSGTRTKAPHVIPISFPGTLHDLAGTRENLGLHKER